MQFHDTGYHDHDSSCGAVAVVEGEVVEEQLAIGGTPKRTIHRKGETFSFDPSHVHRMHNETPRLAVSIHAYSPPLTRLGAYVIEADGTLRRLTRRATPSSPRSPPEAERCYVSSNNFVHGTGAGKCR